MVLTLFLLTCRAVGSWFSHDLISVLKFCASVEGSYAFLILTLASVPLIFLKLTFLRWTNYLIKTF